MENLAPGGLERRLLLWVKEERGQTSIRALMRGQGGKKRGTFQNQREGVSLGLYEVGGERRLPLEVGPWWPAQHLAFYLECSGRVVSRE